MSTTRSIPSNHRDGPLRDRLLFCASSLSAAVKGNEDADDVEEWFNVGFCATAAKVMLEAADALAKAEAVNDAHSLGWYYEDVDGTWREGDDGAFKCLDEDLVSVIAARVLPADMYDALELAAEAFGGVGGVAATAADGCPLCPHGLAWFLVDADVCLGDDIGPIADELFRLGIDGHENDIAVKRYNRRRNRRDGARIPFAAWCRALRVERGA